MKKTAQPDAGADIAKVTPSAAPIEPAPASETSAPADAPADLTVAAEDDLSWMSPAYRASPAEALPRINRICSLCPDLFDAVLLVVATHRGVPREHLAAALKLARPEFEGVAPHDMVGLLTAAWNGGKQGFDAVWRTRAKAGRRAAAASMPWGTTDD
jgi:hypothetical protein